MQKLVRAGSMWLAVLLATGQSGFLRAQAIPGPPRPRMNIAVVEGEAAMHNVRERKPVNVVVIVRDGNRKPVPGASVTFTLPDAGPTAAFADGLRTLTVVSDPDGYATARGIRANTVAGPYRIEVNAKKDDETAEASITQFNMAVEARRGSGTWIAVAAIVGAAAAGGAVAATRGGSNGKSPAASATVTPIGITPGAAVAGPPR